jgi:hypothetical protein
MLSQVGEKKSFPSEPTRQGSLFGLAGRKGPAEKVSY